jgi:MarR family 2-MHQ and catechol resistance regulon transcriptional repressor
MKTPSGPTLFLALWRTSHKIRQADEASIQQAGFRSRSDFAVLEVLLHKGPLPVNTIGKKVLLTSGSITTAVQRLEKQGWVRRSADPGDARKVVIELTPEGRNRIEEAFSLHAKRLEDCFAPLNPKEKKTFIALMKKLRTPPENRT